MQTLDREELFELADAAIEATLTDAQVARLEHLVLTDASARKVYAEYVSLSAALRISQGAPVLNLSSPAPQFATAGTNSTAGSNRWVLNRWVTWPAGVLALAMSLGLAISLWHYLQQPRETVAMLVETKGCMWGSGTLPTEVGAQLTPGRLRLESGLARIVFSSGAELQLESPADLELVSSMKCIVRTGKLVAHVPPSAKGFVVETPSSVITDFGTEFGVSVGHDESAVVQVFEGRVDTLHRRSGRTEVMFEGSMLRFGDKEYGPYGDIEPSVANRDTTTQPRFQKWIQITTAHGRGQDAFVQRQEIPDDDSEKGLLLVKLPYPQYVDAELWERRAYLGFDLSDVAKKEIAAAELSLCFAPTGLGFSSRIPDATFKVYGVKDGPEDEWNEAKLKWDNAPACGEPSELANETKLVLLGSFVIPQGEQSTTVVVSGKALSEFLNGDSNQLVTMLVVRETAGTGNSDLVHGFASRRHPTLPPPTLRLSLNEK